MKRKVIYSIIIMGIYQSVYAQNLVLNSSFEDTVFCPPGAGSVQAYQHWSDPNHLSSDAYHVPICPLTNFQFFIPSNFIGFAYARTGESYVGLVAYSIIPSDYNIRESIQGKLATTLDSNEVYCGGFYVQLANLTSQAVDAMGMYLQKDSIDIPSFPITPMIYEPNPYVENPVGNYLTDTVNWVVIEQSFTAIGNEKFLIIGNLKDYANTGTVQTDTIPYYYAYYYIDDVFLYEQKPVFIFQGDTTLCDTLGPVTLRFNAENAPHYTWYDANNPSVVLSDIDSLVISAPSTTTSYVVRGDACGYTSYDTITVTIVNCEPPTEIIPDVITPNGDGVNDILLIKNLQPGSQLYVYSRWGNLIYETDDYQNNWPDVQNNLSDGVYFYVFTNPQNQIQKGFIHVFNSN